ncbi:hypothetical protein AZE42_03473 [Rhizopogon vesiculosus]|uniref:Uncharacterized protein n=1 Tax=Rhizopogon vesiculosus TaxID=180088 RepID=A0A1J8R215_9AGAM|nr:hypothetical protein AZE42_03473 [Rhizopogon vesiculosus]
MVHADRCMGFKVWNLLSWVQFLHNISGLDKDYPIHDLTPGIYIGSLALSSRTPIPNFHSLSPEHCSYLAPLCLTNAGSPTVDENMSTMGGGCCKHA